MMIALLYRGSKIIPSKTDDRIVSCFYGGAALGRNKL
jgi:hypothetical protein